jgi:hypothetical protein
MTCPHKTEARLPFMQLAGARANIALDTAIFQQMPILCGMMLQKLKLAYGKSI